MRTILSLVEFVFKCIRLNRFDIGDAFKHENTFMQRQRMFVCNGQCKTLKTRSKQAFLREKSTTSGTQTNIIQRVIGFEMSKNGEKTPLIELI